MTTSTTAPASAGPVPGPATTSSGAPLPLVALPQADLLTVHSDEIPVIGDAGSMAFQPLRIDVEANVYVALVHFGPGASVPLHYHTGIAEVHTLAGRWHYAEYPDQPQVAGSYLFEPGGSVHTLVVPEDNAETTVLLVRVEGSNVQFNEDGTFQSILDAVMLRAVVQGYAEAEGIPLPPFIVGGSAARAG